MAYLVISRKFQNSACSKAKEDRGMRHNLSLFPPSKPGKDVTSLTQDRRSPSVRLQSSQKNCMRFTSEQITHYIGRFAKKRNSSGRIDRSITVMDMYTYHFNFSDMLSHSFLPFSSNDYILLVKERFHCQKPMLIVSLFNSISTFQ